MPVTREYAMSMVGRPVIARHVNGTVHQGVLHSVDNRGIYLRQMSGAGYAAAEQKAQADHADLTHQQVGEAEEVFFPFFFLPFFALAALSPWYWW